MVRMYVESVGKLLEESDTLARMAQFILFRGQNCREPLLPKIARKNPTEDTVDLERKMLEELQRRTARSPNVLGKNQWDALVVAQHYGMATRLLDWTTNPLIALWFAVADEDPEQDGYIYLLPVHDGMILDQNADPFSLQGTGVVRPSINNDRLSAQAGWFTAHPFSAASGKFIDLHEDAELPDKVRMKGIKGTDKSRFLQSLDRAGINQESIFPGLEGVCRYVDWQFRRRGS